MKKSVGFYLTVLAAIFLAAGCDILSHDETLPDTISLQLGENSGRVLGGSLSDRLDEGGQGLVFQEVADASRSIKVAEVFADSYRIVAEIKAPSTPLGDAVLGANHVFVSSDYKKAYVSYNLPGAKRYGAVDIVDLDDPANPRLAQSILFPDTDINATFVYKFGTGGYLYIAGSMAESTLSALSTSQTADWFISKNATLERFTVKSDGLIDLEDTGSKLTNLPGYQTTSVFQTYSPAGRYVYATSGDDPSAGTFAFDYTKFPKMIDQDLYDNAKYLDIEVDSALTGRNPKHVTLEGGRGTSGTLHVYTVGKYDASAHVKIDLGQVDTSESRNTVDLYKNIAYVALGADGMKAWDVAKISDQAKYTMTKTDPNGEVVCNSVSSDGENAFLAMGAGGFWVAPLSLAGEDGTLSPFQSVNFGASANFIAYDSTSNLIFIAGGLEGLKIVAKE